MTRTGLGLAVCLMTLSTPLLMAQEGDFKPLFNVKQIGRRRQLEWPLRCPAGDVTRCCSWSLLQCGFLGCRVVRLLRGLLLLLLGGMLVLLLCGR